MLTRTFPKSTALESRKCALLLYWGSNMKNSFVLYTDYFEHFSLLSLEQQGLLINAIFKYQLGEELPEMDMGLKMAFSFIKAQLDRDNEKYENTCEERRKAGEKGGAPKGNQNARKHKQTNQANGCSNKQNQAKQPKQADTDTVNENGNEIVTVYETENATDTDILTYQEVLAIAKEECPVIHKRHIDKANSKMNMSTERKVFELLDRLNGIYTYQQLREIFRKASKMYCSEEKYKGCDLVWLLNNLTEIEQTKLDEEQPNKKLGLTLCACDIGEVEI